MKLPRGVYKYSNNPNKFIAKTFGRFREQKYLGIFDSVEDALLAIKKYNEGTFVSLKTLRDTHRLKILEEVKVIYVDVIDLD